MPPSSLLARGRLWCIARLGGLSPIELVRRVAGRYAADEVPTRAAAIAYFAFAALVPFLAVVIAWVAVLLPPLSRAANVEGLDDTHAAEVLRGTLAGFLPRDAVRVVENQLSRLQRRPPVGLLSVGMALSLYFASGVFSTIIDALNRLHGTAETRPYWRLVLMAVVMAALQAVILIGTLVVILVWPLIGGWLGLRGAAAVAAEVVQWVAVAVALLLSFALTFYVAPNAPTRWEWITPGSVLGTVAALAVSFAFRLYVQHAGNFDQTYGPLGGVVVLLMWMWIMAQIVLVAAEVNIVIEEACKASRRPPYGSPAEPVGTDLAN
jgi:membrane protein